MVTVRVRVEFLGEGSMMESSMMESSMTLIKCVFTKKFKKEYYISYPCTLHIKRENRG